MTLHDHHEARQNFARWIRSATLAEILVILDRAAEELLLRVDQPEPRPREADRQALWESGIAATCAANAIRALAVSSRGRLVTMTLTNLTDQEIHVELRIPFQRTPAIFSADCGPCAVDYCGAELRRTCDQPAGHAGPHSGNLETF